MSIKIMTEVWEHAPVKGGALLFLLALADQAGDQDRCSWPGVAQLSHRARCSERSAYDYAAELQEKGILTRLEDDDRPSRYSRQRGRETTCWRINPVSEWTPAETAPLRDSVTDPCEGSQGTPAVARTRTTTTHQEENPQNPSRASRRDVERPARAPRKMRAAVDTDEGQERAGFLPDDGEQPVVEDRPKPARWSTKALVEEFAFRALGATTVAASARDTNRGALGKTIKKWVTEGTATHDDVAAAMDSFFVAPEVRLRQDGNLWLAFINHFSTLHQRANGSLSAQHSDSNSDYQETPMTREQYIAQIRSGRL